MCGTSHDGLDVACIKFNQQDLSWSFRLLHAVQVELPKLLRIRLGSAIRLSALELVELDRDFARFSSEQINACLKNWNVQPEFISSHGVTIFHDPSLGITTQIGSGAIISSLTKLKVISDFRSQDVAKGGNGAPLVPYADQLLFPGYDFSLNLGGFANVSMLGQTRLIGFDIGPCNLLLNYIANQLGHEFDEGGRIARSGNLIPTLYKTLNAIPFYEQQPPKSLGYEWFESTIIPRITDQSREDLLHTACEHIAYQIGRMLDRHGKCLVTGGGAFNTYLIERIQHYSKCEIVVPDSEIVRFKEAICFAFLGLIRLRGEVNISSTVTGANSDTSAGAVYFP